MKHQEIAPMPVSAPAPVSSDTISAAVDIIEIMEQGIIVWSPEGICEVHNSRVFEVLEIAPGELAPGTAREDFRNRAVAAGEMNEANRQMSALQISKCLPYAFDRHLPSGRVVLTNGRPTRRGGYVVTFTDVTEARAVATALVAAKQAAEEAEMRALDVLKDERARQAEVELLANLNEWLQSCKSLDEVYLIVARFMERLLPGSKGELYIYSNSRDALDGICNWNTHDLHRSIEADACWALRRGRHYVYDEAELCFACAHVEAHHHGVAVPEYLCLPIVAHGDTVGLLHVRFDCTEPGAARIARSATFALRCAEHVSMAIANVKLRDKLHDQSVRDPLTGLYNRRYFMDAIRREIVVAMRRESSFGLISIDADRFKTFNDRHGHDAGDAVLRALADTLCEAIDAGQVVCRMGGEELAILAPGLDAAATMALARRLNEAVGQMEVRHYGGSLPQVTISAGAAVFPGDGATPEALMRAADAALYRAKEAGRDCVCMAAGQETEPARNSSR